MSQRRSGPCGLFSRAEDKMKLSDDVIEEACYLIRDSLSSFISRPPQSSGRSAGSNRRFEFQKRGQLFIRRKVGRVAVNDDGRDKDAAQRRGYSVSPPPIRERGENGCAS